VEKVYWALIPGSPEEEAWTVNAPIGKLSKFRYGVALPGKEALVAAAADRELARRDVDLVVSNQTACEWGAALTRLGYREGPSNFALTCSRKLVESLGPLEQILAQSHVNRGDGDGPIHL